MNLAKVPKALAWLWGRTPMPNPWARDPMSRTIGRHMASRFGIPVWLGALVCWSFWIPRAVLLATRETLANARQACEFGAKPRVVQWLDQVWQAWRYGASPDYYYHYRLFDSRQRAKARDYLASHHSALLCAILDTTSTDFIDDKVGLEKHLARHGVESVRTLATAVGGVVQRKHWTSPELPTRDLIIKPNNSMRGEGIQRVRYRYDDQFEIEGSSFTGAQVMRYLQSRSLHEPCLLQPCLVNHPHLAALAPAALSTVRLISGRDAAGQVQVIIAVLKIAAEGCVADNFAAGGWAAPIDLANGCLGPATCKKAITADLFAHPESGVLLAETRVPDWQSVQDAARAGHHSLPGFVFLAWDIAVTPDGPVVLEANTVSDTLIVQKPGLRPMSQTVFADVARAWL